MVLVQFFHTARRQPRPSFDLSTVFFWAPKAWESSWRLGSNFSRSITSPGLILAVQHSHKGIEEIIALVTAIQAENHATKAYVSISPVQSFPELRCIAHRVNNCGYCGYRHASQNLPMQRPQQHQSAFGIKKRISKGGPIRYGKRYAVATFHSVTTSSHHALYCTGNQKGLVPNCCFARLAKIFFKAQHPHQGIRWWFFAVTPESTIIRNETSAKPGSHGRWRSRMQRSAYMSAQGLPGRAT